MTASEMMPFMWGKSVFNSFKCSSWREEYCMSAGMSGNSTPQEQMRSCVSSPDFKKQSQEATLCSPTTCKAGRCSPSPPNLLWSFLRGCTPLLRRCIQPTGSLLHLPGPSLQGRASAQHAGVSGIPVWHCSHFFSFHRVWAREGSGKDSLGSCYPGRKDFSFFLSCIAKEEPQPESSLCAHPVLGHCTQQEKPMSI